MRVRRSAYKSRKSFTIPRATFIESLGDLITGHSIDRLAHGSTCALNSVSTQPSSCVEGIPGDATSVVAKDLKFPRQGTSVEALDESPVILFCDGKGRA